MTRDIIDGIFFAGILLLAFIGAGTLLFVNDTKSQKCNDDYYIKIIQAQNEVIDKYRGYENWYREVHEIDTTKLVKFREKK